MIKKKKKTHIFKHCQNSILQMNVVFINLIIIKLTKHDIYSYSSIKK